MARPVFRHETARFLSLFRPPSQRRLRYGAVSVFPHRTAGLLLSRGSKIPLPERPPLFMQRPLKLRHFRHRSGRRSLPMLPKTPSPCLCKKHTHGRLRPVSCRLPENKIFVIQSGRQDAGHGRQSAKRHGSFSACAFMPGTARQRR